VTHPFASRGRGVVVDDLARILGAAQVSLGHMTRVDAFAVISATHPVSVGVHVHISVGVKIFASGGRVDVGDFAGLSADVKVYTASDDYTNGALTNPTVPRDFRDITSGVVSIGRHAIVGAGSVLLPGVSLGEGSSVGALSLVRENVAPGVVVAGIPAKPIGRRDVGRLRELEERLLIREGLK
jgi:dTDP-4-amino-4,6-dideoxy-D-glucose acyltransferase